MIKEDLLFLQNTLAYLTTIDFAITISIFSGFSLVVKALSENGALKQCRQLVKRNPEARLIIAQQIVSLISLGHEDGYCNNFDEAITACIFLVKDDLLICRWILDFLTQYRDELFWARSMIRYVVGL